MFVLPSLCSFVFDLCILSIRSSLVEYNNRYDLSESNNNDTNAILQGLKTESVDIICLLASARMFLSMCPLAYHTITGARLRMAFLYYLFYSSSLLYIVLQMCGLLTKSNSNSNSNPIWSSVWKQGLSFTKKEYINNIWLILSLSLLSIGLHFVMVWHVRSSAPISLEIDQTRREAENKKRLMAYAAFNKFKDSFSQLRRSSVTKLEGDEENSFIFFEGSDIESSTDGSVASEEEMPLRLELSSSSDCLLDSPVFYRNKKGKKRQTNGNISNSITGVLDAKDSDFFTEIQNRFKIEKERWSNKLKELHLHRDSIHLNHQTTTNSTPTFFSTLQSHNNNSFQNILGLFAYKDVLSNNRLNLSFEQDGGEAITFYVPQLLSFLLHGAYFNAPELEDWILSKCRENVHFAHRCYWFLQSFCFESNDKNTSATRNDTINGDTFSRRRYYGSENNLTSPSESFDLSDGVVESTSHRRRANSFSGGNGYTSKFSAEENKILEALIFRIVENAEIPARELEFGKKEIQSEIPTTKYLSSNEANSNIGLALNLGDGEPPAALGSFLSFVTEKGYIPIDPSNGFPSVKHLDTITSKENYGFLPSNSSSIPQAETGCFWDTPRFLVALTKIADDLMFVPREKRTKELRKLLRKTEIDLLPGNAVYIPLKDVHHRVWRIVTKESVALSTKERVPCIICLEVVDYENTTKVKKKNYDERNILNQWYKNDRPPHRHNSLFEKVTKSHQSFFKKIIPDFENSNSKNNNNNLLFFEENLDEIDDINSTRQPLINKEDKILRAQHQSQLPPLPVQNQRMSISPEKRRVVSYQDNDSFVSSSACSSVASSKGTSQLKKLGQWGSPPENKLRMQRKQFHDDKKSPKKTKSPRKAHRHRRIPSESSDISITSRDSIGSLHHSQESKPPSILVIDSPTSQVQNKRTSTKRPPVVFKEDWAAKESRLRARSAFSDDPNWRLLPILIKSNDDLRQEQLASQLIQRMAIILAKGKVPVWLNPYEIVALSDRGGIIEAIPDTISLNSLKRNYPNFTTLPDFFEDHFGSPSTEEFCAAKANFVESMAAYSIVCYLLQIKDRHNGNILLTSKGHIIHIDFGFFFLSSPGKNSGFESAPFKLTTDFVNIMGGPHSRTFARFRYLCYRTFIELRKNCFEITLLVEMLMEGNEDLPCFRNKPEDAVKELRERFRLDLNDGACVDFVNSLVNESLENWRTTWYDRYQRYCVGVL